MTATLTPTRVFTFNDVRKGLKTVAAEQGNEHGFTREEPSWCLYTGPDGKALCAIGRLFDVLGIERPAYGTTINGEIVNVAVRHLPNVDFTDAAVALMCDVQEVNDSDIHEHKPEDRMTLAQVIADGLAANRGH